MLQKYRAMAEIVAGEIHNAVAKENVSELFSNNDEKLKAILLKQANFFQGEVQILDKNGWPIENKEDNEFSKATLSKPVFLRPLKNFPYTIAVYERYPVIAEQLAEKRQRIGMYIAIIIFAAISILSGSAYTLWALAQEWRQAKLKSAFVSQLSHDIRKPLTSIRMFSEMLEEGHLPNEEKKREYYKIISDESNKLTELANSILDFSRIESGRIKYNFQEVNMVELIQSIIKRFQIQTPDRRIQAHLSEVTAFVDIQAMRQAVMNLLTNADKYSPKDKNIQVNLKVGTGPTFFCPYFLIEVIDEGKGIPRSEQKKIFQKFYRVLKKTGDVQGIEGTGLGLTFVKYMAEAHKGSIKVESEEGKGSKFILQIPLNQKNV